jgi:hypothetical protein
VVMTTDPTAAKPTWGAPVDVDGRNFLGGISCASTYVCVAADSAGNVIVGHGIPTAKQIRTSLSEQLTPHGKTGRIRSLLEDRGYSVSFNALSAGRLVIDWYYVPRRTQVRKPKSVLVAAAKPTFAQAGPLIVTIKLTQAGQRLLERADRLRLTAHAAFTPAGGRSVTATARFSLLG